MTAPATRIVTLYTRPGCSLCLESRANLDALRAERARAGLETYDVEERDISADADLESQFRDVIPVVEVGERRLELAVSVGRLRRLLREGLGDPAETPSPR